MSKVFVAIAYAVVLVLVIGGLAAVTMTALRVEAAQQSAQAEAQLATKTRLALWRLDTRLYTDLAREADDLPGHYRVRLPADFRVSRSPPHILSPKKGEGSGGEGPLFFDLVATPKAAKLPYIKRHYLVFLVFRPRSGPFDPWYEQFGIAADDQISGQDQESVLIASRLAADGRLRERLAEPQQVAAATSEPNTAQVATAQGDRDLGLRNSLQMAQNSSMPKLPTGPLTPNGRIKKSVVSIVGGVVPIWTAGPEPMLVLARSLQGESESAHILSVLDWRHLVSQLHDDISDLVPDAELRPIRSGPSPAPERALTALPFELAGTVPPVRSPGWTPLRLGLVLMWSAAVVALAAVALGGLSLWELSQRRMRFVSTVTHELRTPLTTIRLYIDMLAQGMVVDPEKRIEYLETLRTEADRLDRLVRNVLDFSRLENQTPRFDRRRVQLCSLLGTVTERWQNACLRSGKTLVMSNEIDSSFELVTDAAIVEQILGNLIDNACKYSKDATNPQIELKAQPLDHGRIVLEVQDYGPGVKEAERAAIFRPFRRGVASAELSGGVGLGLALAARWARLLGGSLELAPASTKSGACFRLILNAAR
jgi:signal transduction histidine kinase